MHKALPLSVLSYWQLANVWLFLSDFSPFLASYSSWPAHWREKCLGEMIRWFINWLFLRLIKKKKKHPTNSTIGLFGSDHEQHQWRKQWPADVSGPHQIWCLLVLHKKHQVYKTGAELKAKRKRVSKHRVNSGDTTAAPDQDFGQLSRQSKTQKTYFCNKCKIFYIYRVSFRTTCLWLSYMCACFSEDLIRLSEWHWEIKWIFTLTGFVFAVHAAQQCFSCGLCCLVCA